MFDSCKKWSTVRLGGRCRDARDGARLHTAVMTFEPEHFPAIENGADTFDCVSPSRVARNSAVYSKHGRFNLMAAGHRRAFEPIDADCDCYTCQHYTRAYLHHLFRSKEMLSATLATIHNEYFIVQLVAHIRQSILDGTYWSFKREFLSRYNAGR